MGTVHRLRPAQEVDGRVLLERFLAFLERNRRLSPHTIDAYARRARFWVEWLDEHPEQEPWVDQIGAAAALTDWKRELLDARKSVSTINQAIDAVNLLYRNQLGWMLDVRRIPKGPLPTEPDGLEPAEERALTRTAARLGLVEDALIWFLLGTGARIEEAARLTMADLMITAKTGYVRLHGKGDKVREVALPSGRPKEKLEKYLAYRMTLPELVDGDADKVWIGRTGRPLTRRGLQAMAIRIGETAGIHPFGPHLCRHQAALKLRRDGADVAKLQDWLGHRDIKTSARYFRASKEELRVHADRALG